jgi:hypothetical protein
MRIVSSLEQLAALPCDRAVNGFGPRTRLRLEIPAASRQSLLRAERALNRLQSRCGCVAGGIATLSVLAAGIAALFLGDTFLDDTLVWSWRLPARVLLILVGAFALGLAAKFLTLAATRWQFARACRVQHRALARTASASRTFYRE